MPADATAVMLRGAVVSGVGEAAGFVAIPWVRDAIRARTGFDPYPGTLNVLVSDASMLGAWRRIREAGGARLTPPQPDGCGGRIVDVTVAPAIPAAVVVPDITRYGEEILEVVAADHLRSALGLQDGDIVTLTCRISRFVDT